MRGGGGGGAGAGRAGRALAAPKAKTKPIALANETVTLAKVLVLTTDPLFLPDNSQPICPCHPKFVRTFEAN